jgi:hypothetical protein
MGSRTVGAESGGLCTFCGRHVTLHYLDGSTSVPPDGTLEAPWPPILAPAPPHPRTEPPPLAQQRSAAAAPPGPRGGSSRATAARSGSTAGADATASAAATAAAAAATAAAAEGATAAAQELRERLVEYDRNSAKRMTVIDDQSDFFEIDTNAWLTDEVGGSAAAGNV